jgi:hypothetical protein
MTSPTGASGTAFRKEEGVLAEVVQPSCSQNT